MTRLLPVIEHGWPHDADRPRVLLEDDGGSGGPTERYLIAHGYDVAVCRGPNGSHELCGLLIEGRCRLAARADVVYTRLHWGDRDRRQVLDSLRERYPDTPVVIELPHGERWPDPHALDGRELVLSQAGPKAIREAIERALAAAHTEPETPPTD